MEHVTGDGKITTKPIILVVGARPNFMKIAPIYAELQSRGQELILLHTGQHYDDNMSKVFFDDLGMPKPDIYMGIGSGSHAYQTGTVMIEFEKICQEKDPSMVVVVGDVNSTVACTIVCAKMGIPCAHVEAGLRSFDRDMPEEINRILTDSVADLLLTPSPDGDEHLRAEGIAEERIIRVGNVMIDSLYNNLARAESSSIQDDLGLEDDYSILTLHRPSNVDDQEIFAGIISALEVIGKEIQIVFPMHPRTEKMAKQFSLYERIASIPRIKITGPVGYLDFVALMSNSKLVLTDSGGLQEETTALGIPCITLRENTERPITVTEGTNTIVGCDPELIKSTALDALTTGGKSGRIPEMWDGKTAHRIADVLINYIENNGD
ncbi:MAG: non-hydrolyzing UDP-N-acetylglucosamine 2-epimerase [Candidatus Poseidoniaceae archaeon]